MHEANRTTASIMRLRALSGLPPASTPSFPFMRGSCCFPLSRAAGRRTEALRTCISTVFGSTHLEAWDLFYRLCEGNLVRSVGMSCAVRTAGASGIASGLTSGIYRCTVRYSPPDPKIVCFFARSIRYLCIRGHHMYNICGTDW
jgi:hypothetical protein